MSSGGEPGIGPTLAEERVALLNANLVTKADIAKVEAGMETLRHETKAAIEAVKADLVKSPFGALIAQGGLIVAFVKLPPPESHPILRRGTTRLRRVMSPGIGVATVLNRRVCAGSSNPASSCQQLVRNRFILQ